MQLLIKSSFGMEKFAGTVAQVCDAGFVVYLSGELGVGKTVFVRGFLHKLGYTGRVHSPTFKLLEIYQLASRIICHVDLYRLNAPEELAYIGITDYINTQNIWLIEWAENGMNFLPKADIMCKLTFAKRWQERNIEIVGCSLRGTNALQKMVF